MIFDKVLQQIKDHRLLCKGDKVLLALSGGADSTALLHLFLEIKSHYRLKLVIAHLNHQFRSNESRADATFVKSMANYYKVPFITENLSPPAVPRFGNQENWAREERYKFFQKVADSISAQKIALGHTKNDQAETVLLRLLRGSGTLGLAGMPVSRGNRFIRPLLSIKREEIHAYLNLHQWPWREDSSNKDLQFSRNRVRLEVIPSLEKFFNPNLVEVLARTAENLRGDSETLEWLVSRLWGQYVQIKRNGFSWSVNWFQTLPLGLQRNLIRYTFNKFETEDFQVLKKHVDAVIDLIGKNKNGKLTRIGKIEVRREFDELLFEKFVPGSVLKSYCYRLRIPGEVQLPQIGSVFEAFLNRGSNHSKLLNHWHFYLSPEAVAQGLKIRNWQAGDAYHPYGSLKLKKIKELFLKKKIGLNLRPSWPIVICDERIICAKGFPTAADKDLHEPLKTDLEVVIEERAIM